MLTVFMSIFVDSYTIFKKKVLIKYFTIIFIINIPLNFINYSYILF